MLPCTWKVWLFHYLLVDGKAEKNKQYGANKIIEEYFILLFQGYIFNYAKNGDI